MEKTIISTDILTQLNLPQGITIRRFCESDFPEIQSMYEKEGWLTVVKRPEEALKAWVNSNLVLVAVFDNRVCGVIRGFTDTEITTYIIELLIGEELRGKGIGKSLIEACHLLYPRTRIEVLASETSKSFYESFEFRSLPGFRKSYI